MSLINIPKYYENEPGIIKKSGELIKEFGKKAFIIGSKTALRVALTDLSESLSENGIRYAVRTFEGYPSRTWIEYYSKEIEGKGYDIIIGIGGGKVMDLTKAIGFLNNLNVITVPTIPATCAAWSALSVIYDDDGVQTEYIRFNKSPSLIIADKEILSKAPLRYINAGVADTFAKWYEIEPDLRKYKDDFALKLQVKISELALEILKNDYVAEYGNDNKQVLNNTIDAIILLAGLTGSINGAVPYGGFAHPFYNNSTKVSETNKLLHGEKVIFGLLVQLTLEGKDDEVEEIVKINEKLGLPTTLKDIGIEEDIEEKLGVISEGIINSDIEYAGIDYKLTKEKILEAVLKVDRVSQAVSI